MKKLIAVAVLAGFNTGYAQMGDGLSVSSSLLSKNDRAGIHRSEFSFQKTIPVNEKGNSLILGARYIHSSFDFEDRRQSFPTSELERFHAASVKAGYLRILNSKWSLRAVAEPGVSSNFDGAVKFRDFTLTAYVVATMSNKEHTAFFSFGMAYDLQLGFPVGVVSYYRIVNEKLSYHLGVPSFYLNYNFSKRSAIQPFAKLDWTLANIGKPVLPDQEKEKSRLSHLAVIGGLGYHYKIGKSFSLFAEGGYSIFNELQIQTYKLDDNVLYDFDLKNSLYLNAGIRYTLD
ncbi:DUF6268 family outer membrane beta-barrel protein [Sinomicrobium kalidii]|uniref:DUF6268 family outer membrane beta-barrel protein n=1 Tax=Sinomicrobium kalidii TaxID=2900738 RepID=UPI001E36DACF|nr:DUF6268 family outer membrane beta-barrel protein [Sinomicrobium kalidii]UGU14939.1 DUF6268 family outer membrane beta-barrel protein [Sinomicrobium kalidii]